MATSDDEIEVKDLVSSMNGKSVQSKDNPTTLLLAKEGSRQRQNYSTANTGRIWLVLLYSLIACFGGVIGGYSHGFPSPTLLDLQQYYDRGDRTTAFQSNSVYAGIFGAIGPIGALCGGAVAGPIADKLGRSVALILMNVPHLIGWLGQAYAPWSTTFQGFTSILMLGRWFTGFGTGWGSLIISVYIVEISPAKLKGLFGSMYWLSTAIGILLVYVLGAIPGFTYYSLSLSTASLVLPCIILNWFLPESPRWLVAHEKNIQAYNVLKRLRGSKTDITTEIKDLETNFSSQDEKVGFCSSLKLLTERSTIVPLLLSTTLMFFQQFTGTNVVMFYAGTILTDAKVTDAKQVAGYAVGVTQVIATFISVLLVDCVGRKILLIFSGIFVCLSTGLLGLYYFLTEYACKHFFKQEYDANSMSGVTLLLSNTTGHLPDFCDPVSSKFYYLAICCVMLFIVSYSLGWATIPWVMMSELSPLRVRGIVSSIATTANWTSAAFLTGVFPLYQNVVQHFGSWWTLTGIMLLSIPFVGFLVPETKAKSLEEIEQRMRSPKRKEMR